MLLKHVPSASHAVAMKCNACARQAIGNFRARDEGEPFLWWCNDCYGTTFAGIVVAHDIEHPIICCECHELPADLRSQSKAMPDWRYWCHVCYERYEHEDFLHNVHDFDSASDESDQYEESDDGLELDDELHESASLSSWQHHEEAFSLK